MVRIAIVEDNSNSASLLKECAETEGYDVLGVYSCGEDLLQALESQRIPDVLLLDLGLPGLSGIEVARLVKINYPSVEIIIQTVFEDPDSILGAIRAGASGYLLKAHAFEEMRRAVEEVMAGGSSLSPIIARKVLVTLQPAEQETEDTSLLSAREREILDELVTGAPIKTIAARLDISPHTVNNHLRKVYEKLRVDSRAEAVAVALGTQKKRQGRNRD